MAELDCNRIRSILIKDGDLRFRDLGAHQSPQFPLIPSLGLLRSLCSGGRRGCRGGEADAVALLRYSGLLLPGTLSCHVIMMQSQRVYLFDQNLVNLKVFNCSSH